MRVIHKCGKTKPVIRPATSNSSNLQPTGPMQPSSAHPPASLCHHGSITALPSSPAQLEVHPGCALIAQQQLHMNMVLVLSDLKPGQRRVQCSSVLVQEAATHSQIESRVYCTSYALVPWVSKTQCLLIIILQPT